MLTCIHLYNHSVNTDSWFKQLLSHAIAPSLKATSLSLTTAWSTESNAFDGLATETAQMLPVQGINDINIICHRPICCYGTMTQSKARLGFTYSLIVNQALFQLRVGSTLKVWMQGDNYLNHRGSPNFNKGQTQAAFQVLGIILFQGLRLKTAVTGSIIKSAACLKR